MDGEVLSLVTAKEDEINKQKIKIYQKMTNEFKEVFGYDIKPSSKNYLLQAIFEDYEKELLKINVR